MNDFAVSLGNDSCRALAARLRSHRCEAWIPHRSATAVNDVVGQAVLGGGCRVR